MQKKKLTLNKKILLSLSDAEKKAIVGGDAYTTSFTNCTHFLCCGDYCTTLPPIKTPYPDDCVARSVPTWCPPSNDTLPTVPYNCCNY
jgi:hypothetical protein